MDSDSLTQIQAYGEFGQEMDKAVQCNRRRLFNKEVSMQHPPILKVSRLESLTDGTFAIAMTILILNLNVPDEAYITSLPTFFSTNILLKLFIYAGSFIILGTLWIGMHFQIGFLDRVNRPYLWTHIFYLMIVCVVPFSASLFAAHPNNVIAISFFAVNLLCASLIQYIICVYSNYYRLNKPNYSPEIRRAIVGRIMIAPLFYVGALVAAHWNPSLAFVLLITPILIYTMRGHVDRYDM